MTRLAPIQVRTEAETALIEAFDSADQRLRGASDLRAAAMARFSEAGLPNRRVEAWHYTDLRNLLRRAAPVRSPDSTSLAKARECLSGAHGETKACRLVLLNGEFRAELSDLKELPSGVTVTSLSEELVAGNAEVLSALIADGLGGDDSVVALNAALMQDGVVIRVAAGAQVERALAVVNMMTGGAAHAAFVRSLVLVGDGASVSLSETSGACTPAGTQTNEAMVLAIGDDAKVEYIARTTQQGADAVCLHSLLVTIGARSKLDAFSHVSDPGLVRRQIFARLNGRHTTVGFGGLSLLRDKQHADTTLVVDHAVPDCSSREFFRYILDDASTGVFQGKVVVRQHAQKTDGAMKSQAIMLGDDAVMNNKPELEIFADDVVCGHGATVGQLDDDQIFYLQTRGLPRAEAESLLLEAFAFEALERVGDEECRSRMIEDARVWLAQRGAR